MRRHPFHYDPTFPIRDPRTKGAKASSEDVILDMAAVIALKVGASHDGTVYEAELLDAGFSRAEIANFGPAARTAARERLAPRQVDAERKAQAA